MKRIVCFFIAVFFIVSVCPNAELIGGVYASQNQPLLNLLEENAIVEKVGGILPEPASGKPVVFLIQDIHADSGAQLNIERMITQIEDFYGPIRVLAEGGSGKFNADFFLTNPNPDIVRSILNSYVERGEFSGAELAAATHQTASTYFGMEDWKLYTENRSLMRKGIQIFPAINREIQKMEEFLNAKGEILFADKFKNLRAYRQNYKAGKINSLEYVKKLNQYLNNKTLSEEGFPCIFKLLQVAEEWTEDLTRKADIEKKNLIRQIEQIGKFTPSQFSDAYLIGEAEKLNFDPGSMAYLSKIAKFESFLDELRGIRFVDELERFEGLVLEGINQDVEFFKIWTLLEKISAVKKLVRLELSREEALKVTDNPIQYLLPVIMEEIKERFSEFKIKTSHEGAVAEIYIPFYEKAFEREAVFKNYIGDFLEKSSQPLVVLAGGFHKSALESYISAQKINYLSLIPKIEGIQEESPYWALMSGNASYAEADRPKEFALALATVLTYLSNPEAFIQFQENTGQEIMDALELDRAELDPTAYLLKWEEKLNEKVTDKELKKELNLVIFRLLIRTLIRDSSNHKWLSDSTAFKQQLTLAAGKINDLFLLRGLEIFPENAIGELIEGLREFKTMPGVDIGDALLLVEGVRRDISYNEMRNLLFQYVKNDSRDPKFSEEEMVEIAINYDTLSFPRTPELTENWDALLEKYKGRQLKDFLESEPISDIHSPAFGLANDLRISNYALETPIQTITEDWTYRKKRLGASPQNQYQKGTHVLKRNFGEGKILRDNEDAVIDSNGVISESVPRVTPQAVLYEVVETADPAWWNKTIYQMLLDAFQELRQEYAMKREVLIDDSTFDLFQSNFNNLNLSKKYFLKAYPSIADTLGKVLTPEMRPDHYKVLLSELKKKLEELSQGKTALFSVYQAKQAVALHEILMHAIALGKYRQDISRAVSEREVKLFDKRISRLQGIAREIAGLSSEESYDTLKKWAAEKKVNMEDLWAYFRGYNYRFRYQLKLVSDQNYDERMMGSTAWVYRHVSQIRLSKQTLKNLPELPDDFKNTLIWKGSNTIYFLKEKLDQLGDLIEEKPEIGINIAKAAIDHLREEFEHTAPLGYYTLFVPSDEEYKQYLLQLLKGKGFDRSEVELFLRRIDLKERSYRNRTDNEEAIIRYRIAGDTLEELVKHYANYYVGLIGLDGDMSPYLFRARLHHHFYNAAANTFWGLAVIRPEDATGAMASYEGQTILTAIEKEATKLYRKLHSAKGASLGILVQGETVEKMVDLFIEKESPSMSISAIDNIYTGRNELSEMTVNDILEIDNRDRQRTVQEALNKWLAGQISLEGLEEELGVKGEDEVRTEFRQILEEEFPDLFAIESRRIATGKSLGIIEKFFNKTPELKAGQNQLSDDIQSFLSQTQFSKLITKNSSLLARPASIYYLPAEAPQDPSELREIIELIEENQMVTLFEVEAGPLKRPFRLIEVKNQLSKEKLSIELRTNLLSRVSIKRVRNLNALQDRLKKDVSKNVKEAKGVVIFGEEEWVETELPPSDDVVYVMMVKGVSEFGWLDQKMQEIGFILSGLSTEEAQKFQENLSSYGIGFEKTERGTIVRIKDLETLLKQITQEFNAARSRAIAA